MSVTTAQALALVEENYLALLRLPDASRIRLQWLLSRNCNFIAAAEDLTTEEVQNFYEEQVGLSRR